MIKLLTSYMGYGLFAEISLVMFAMIFVAVVIRTLLTRSETTNRQANIVLDGNWEDSENFQQMIGK